MLLSTQMFERIAGLSDEPGRPVTVIPVGCRRAQDRRKVSRMSLGQRTQVCRDSGKKAGVWETVMVKDISTMGVGFVCNDAIDVGDTVMVKLTDKEGQSIRIRCKIERCERGGFGSVAYLIGATYQQLIQQQQIRINDDDDDVRPWRDQSTTGQVETAGASGLGGRKLVARAMRAATGWMRKADDFS